MKSLILLVLSVFAAILSPAVAFAAKETVDLVTIDAPKGWSKEVKPRTSTTWTSTNPSKGTWCQIAVMLSVDSRGTLEKDFDAEWKSLIAEQYKTKEAPKTTGPATRGAWQIKGGVAPFTFNGAPATARLSTMTGFGKTLSIVAITNSSDYAPAIDKVLASVELPSLAVATPAAPNGAALATTSFDDGWTSTAQADWVEVTKNATRVLVHYPNKSADTFNGELLPGLENAWSVLVGPRYASIKNLVYRPVRSWQSVEFAEADASEKAGGRAVHVVLFRKGNGRYLEFITPDKATFEREFGAWHDSSDGWDNLEKMAGYNKFIVSQADLQGTWTSDFGSSISYVNAVTGLSAGTDTHSSVEKFKIGPGARYAWELTVASGMVGNLKFQNAKSSGTFAIASGGWKVTFSDIEGKPRTMEASFSFVKGLRVLWLDGEPFAKAD